MSTSGISFLGQSQAQSTRLQTLRQQLTDLQRQATTQKKYERMSGFGFGSLRVQNYRMDFNRLESYTSNIDNVNTRIKLMSTSMEQVSTLGRQLASTIGGELLGGNVDMTSIKVVADGALDFIQSLINTNIDGRFLFSGSATNIEPLNSTGPATTVFQADVADWLSGTITTTQLIGNANSYTANQVGFDPGLSAAGPVSIRIDDAAEVDYSVLANMNGFDKILKAITLAANIEIPDPLTDVPNNNDLSDALQGISNLVRQGIEEMDEATASLGGKFNLLNTVQERHNKDLALLQGLIDKEENADTTEVIASMQLLQTQLQASYEITRIVSQLTLVNYL